MSKCGGAEGKTRNKAFRVVEARSGRYDKKVTCIKKKSAQAMHTVSHHASVIVFSPLLARERTGSLSLFLARQKNILQ